MELTENVLYYWLSTSGIGAGRQNRLLEVYSVEEIYDRVNLFDKELVEFLDETAVQKMRRFSDAAYLEKRLDNLYNNGISFITVKDERFSERLAQREVCPPTVLFYKGDISLLDTSCVAMVGTRTCSRYGTECAERIAAELSEYSITVVSGMATGIDAYSHQAVLDANGKTIAVLGSGINKAGPAQNLGLFARIVENGLVVSEYDVDYVGSKYTFPERNRIISGLSSAVIVVEAAKKSGALITADRAVEQNREVFAIPGNITSGKSEGTNALIKNGARLLTGVKDILTFFNVQRTEIIKNNTAVALDIYEEKIYNLLQNAETDVNELAEKSGFTVQEVVEIAFSLEMKGMIERAHNNTYRIARALN